MSGYQIVPDGLDGFGVEITSPGRFLSVRGFATKAEAEAWIAEQQFAQTAVDNAAKPFSDTPGGHLAPALTPPQNWGKASRRMAEDRSP
jgi:hypothetical protein